MENLIYQITNEIKGLDEYLKAMKKNEPVKRKREDLENLQMHINNLKAWAGIADDARENSLHKHVVVLQSEQLINFLIKVREQAISSNTFEEAGEILKAIEKIN